MAYTNTWSVIIPAGTDPLNTADDQIRQLRLDLQERMNDIVVDWTVDPVVLAADIEKITGTPNVARVFTNAAFALPSGVATIIDFVAETFDTGNPTTGFHDNAVNPSRLTITTASYYRVSANIGVTSGAAAATAVISILKNGSIIASYRRPHAGGSTVEGYKISVIDLAAAADHYQVQINQSSGNSWNTLSTAIEAFFEIERRTGTI